MAEEKDEKQLTGQKGKVWCQAAAEVVRARHLPLRAFTVGTQGDLVDSGRSWATTYDVEEDGTVLVRPDGHVAWRSRSGETNPVQILQGVFASILGESEPLDLNEATRHIWDQNAALWDERGGDLSKLSEKGCQS